MNYKQLIINMVESIEDSESLELIYTCVKVLFEYEHKQPDSNSKDSEE